MALETGQYISDLVVANPQSTDAVSQADDHIRLIKNTIKNTFPNVTGPVTKTQAQINDALEKAGGTMTGPLVLSGAPTVDLNPATKKYADDINSSLNTTIVGLDAAKANNTVTITAGTGLTGGGNLTTNRTISIASGGVGTTQLADNGVTTAKIADGNITAAKLSGGQSGTAPVYGARAWVNFDGTGANGAKTPRASGNIASVTKNGTGDFTITFTTAMPDANYAVSGSATRSDGTQSMIVGLVNTTAPTASACRIQVKDDDGVMKDPLNVHLVIFR